MQWRSIRRYFNFLFTLLLIKVHSKSRGPTRIFRSRITEVWSNTWSVWVQPIDPRTVVWQMGWAFEGTDRLWVICKKRGGVFNIRNKGGIGWLRTLCTHISKTTFYDGSAKPSNVPRSSTRTKAEKKESVTTVLYFLKGRTWADSRSWKVDWPKKESATIVKRDHWQRQVFGQTVSCCPGIALCL